MFDTSETESSMSACEGARRTIERSAWVNMLDNLFIDTPLRFFAMSRFCKDSADMILRRTLVAVLLFHFDKRPKQLIGAWIFAGPQDLEKTLFDWRKRCLEEV
jgi:hypothetical protein